MTFRCQRERVVALTFKGLKMNFKQLVICSFLMTGCGCEQVDTGHRGIETRFGEIQGEPLPEGLHFYNPFTSTIYEIEVRERKIEGKAISFTRDTQRADIDFALTLYPDPIQINKIYKQFGIEWEQKLVAQAIQNAIKDVVGQYIADELVSKRDEARLKSQAEVVKNLAMNNIIVTRLDFVNLDFDDAYEKAVEAKVVAIQKAAEAKNKTVEVEETAKQTVMSAKADAESMQIKSEALKANKGLVEYEISQRWDGHLPAIMAGGGSNMFNIPQSLLDRK